MSKSDVEELVKQWTEVFNTEVLQYATPNEASDEEVYANIYHSLAHSPLAATMIQLEHSHASAVTKTDELVSTSNSEDDWVSRHIEKNEILSESLNFLFYPRLISGKGLSCF